MGRKFANIALFALFALQGSAAAKTAAVVNGTRISEEKVIERIKKKHYADALREIVDETLILQEAKRLGVKVSPGEVEKKAKEIKSQYAGEKDFFGKTGLTDRELKDKIRKDLIIKKTVIKAEKIKFTNRDLKKFFEENRKALTGSKSVKLRQIFVKTEKDANDAYIALRAGADFAKLSSLKSSDENLRKNGGNLGYIKKGILVKKIEDIVFGMKKGDFTAPIKVPGGYTLLMVEDIKEPKEPRFRDFKKKIRAYLMEREVNKKLPVLLKKLREKASINLAK